MDPRTAWQALQTQLKLGQTKLDAGDRTGALEAANAALALDPHSVAAHALHDRILSSSDPAEPATPPAPAEAFAQFEQRARRRRVDRRVDALRAAIDAGRLNEAAAALDEVAELDANLPELHELRERLETLRITRTSTHYGRKVVAAALAFAAVLLVASRLQESVTIRSRSLTPVGSLVAPTAGMVVATATPSIEEPVEPAREPTDAPRKRAEPAAVAMRTAPVLPAAPATLPASAAVPAAVPASVAPAPPVLPSPNDDALVKQALLRYRNAYEDLDARSARAVWPAVDEEALARAFGALASQTLTFDTCYVVLHGQQADATCRGTARYVPKIGSREPHVEPRTWNFMLKKDGAAWTIESARAER